MIATIANAMTDAVGYVYGYGATELDYCAGLYYDPAVYSRFVEGNFQSENFRLLADGYSEGYADWYPAEVGFRYNQPIGNEYYNTDSVHYVLDYYYGGRRVVAAPTIQSASHRPLTSVSRDRVSPQTAIRV